MTDPPGADFISAMFAAIDSKAHDRLGEYFHPDVRYERPGFAPIQGFDDLLDFYRNRRPIAAGAHHVHHTIVAANRAAAAGRFLGTMKDGAVADVRFADLYVFVDGLVRSRTTYFFRPAI